MNRYGNWYQAKKLVRHHSKMQYYETLEFIQHRTWIRMIKTIDKIKI